MLEKVIIANNNKLIFVNCVGQFIRIKLFQFKKNKS